MTGETYTYDYQRAAGKADGMQALQRAKEREAQYEQLVKQGKLRKVYDVNTKNLIEWHYEPV